MPIFWRYALSNFFKYFLVSIGTFISVLIVSRFKEIARFAALSADWGKTGLFTLFKIPLILPMAIPLSILIASFLLCQQMSRSREIAALRASGFGYRHILAPILFASALLSLANFSIYNGLSPFCHRASMRLLYQETTGNPLLLLQRQGLIRLRHAYLQLRGDGEKIKDFILIARNEGSGRLRALAAKKLTLAGDELVGEKVALISHLQGGNGGFDPLFIENQERMSTAAPLLSDALKKNRPKIDSRSLDLRMLAQRIHCGHKAGKTALTELWRRATLALAAFSFGLLGCAFGMEAGRTAHWKSKAAPFAALFLALLLLSSYFLGKGLRFDSAIAGVSFLAPHLLIGFFSLRRLRRLSRGIS